MDAEIYNERYGRMAVKMRMISDEEFEKACKIAAADQKPLDQVLLEQNFITEKEHQELELALSTTGVFDFKE